MQQLQKHDLALTQTLVDHSNKDKFFCSFLLLPFDNSDGQLDAP